MRASHAIGGKRRHSGTPSPRRPDRCGCRADPTKRCRSCGFEPARRPVRSGFRRSLRCRSASRGTDDPRTSRRRSTPRRRRGARQIADRSGRPPCSSRVDLPVRCATSRGARGSPLGPFSLGTSRVDTGSERRVVPTGSGREARDEAVVDHPPPALHGRGLAGTDRGIARARCRAPAAKRRALNSMPPSSRLPGGMPAASSSTEAPRSAPGSRRGSPCVPATAYRGQEAAGATLERATAARAETRDPPCDREWAPPRESSGRNSGRLQQRGRGRGARSPSISEAPAPRSRRAARFADPRGRDATAAAICRGEGQLAEDSGGPSAVWLAQRQESTSSRNVDGPARVMHDVGEIEHRGAESEIERDRRGPASIGRDGRDQARTPRQHASRRTATASGSGGKPRVSEAAQTPCSRPWRGRGGRPAASWSRPAPGAPVEGEEPGDVKRDRDHGQEAGGRAQHRDARPPGTAVGHGSAARPAAIATKMPKLANQERRGGEGARRRSANAAGA